jgi:ATP-dependent exoDNAse (exonuclease V) beta subunit
VVVLANNGIHESASFEDLMYVGITRGRDRLVVVGTPDHIQRIKG